MTLVYVGLGSNLGDRESMITSAADLIDAVRLSTIRETELAPRPLLERLLEVEKSLGRERDGPRWGPRTIDLDLLLYGELAVDEPGLTVPHPRLAGRLFVLEPLAELAPAQKIPGNGTVSQALAGLQSGS